MKTIKIKLTKLAELEDALHPYNISEGVISEFNVVKPTFKAPELGQRFTLIDCIYRDHWFSTSGVREIINENEFKTYNSIYRWEIID